MAEHPYTVEEVARVAAGPPVYDWPYVSALLAWAAEALKAEQDGRFDFTGHRESLRVVDLDMPRIG